MKKYLYLLSFIFILTSCVDAPENGRDKGKDDGRDQGEQNGPCPNCISVTSELNSNLHRTPGIKPLKLETMRKAFASKEVPKGYRVIPNPSEDHSAKAKTYNYSSSQLGEFNDCGEGESLNSVQSMMNSCFNNNNEQFIWSAEANGNSGEADWQIVLLNNEKGYLFWIDKRTNLIWSQRLKDQEDWNSASGQNLSTDEITLCAKLNDIGSKHISWRLPNRAEFLQADIDGARHVLSQTNNFFWTATSEQNTNNAWAIDQSTGILKLIDKNSHQSVRCVGEMLK